MYSASFAAVFEMSSIPAIRAAAKLHTPKGASLLKEKEYEPGDFWLVCLFAF